MTVVLKQSTTGTISFGPFVSNIDGVTLVTNLVGTGSSQTENPTTGIRISKNGGAFAARHAPASTSTYDAFGNYLVFLDSTDTGTLGVLRVQFVNATGFVPVWQDFMIASPPIWNAFYGTGYQPVNACQVNGTLQTAQDLGANLDVKVSSRLPSGTVTLSSSQGGVVMNITGTIVGNVWGSVTGSVQSVQNPVIAGYVTGSVFGALMGSVSGSVSSVVGLTASNLDVKVSSRLASGTLGNLDVPVSSRMATGSLAYLDVPVSSRMASGTVSISGLTASYLDVPVSSRMSSGTVVVGTNNDKSSYSLAANQQVISTSVQGGYVSVSGSVVSSSVTNPITASVVQGGYVTVSGSVNIGTVASIQGGYVTVSGSVNVAGLTPSNLDVPVSSRMSTGSLGNLDVPVSSRQPTGTVIVGTNSDKSGYSLSPNQQVISTSIQGGYVSVSGTVVASAVQGGYVTNSGTVSIGTIQAVQGGYVTVSGSVNVAGLTPAYLDVPVSSRLPTGSLVYLDVPISSRIPTGSLGNLDIPVSSRMASGSVTVSVNLDKLGYALSNPQTFNLIGNILGYVGMVTGSAMSLISGSAGGGSTPAQIWSYAQRTLTDPQIWSLVGNILGSIGMVTGSVMSLVSGTPSINNNTNNSTSNYNNTFNHNNSTDTYYAQAAPTTPPSNTFIGGNVNVLTGDTWNIIFNNLGLIQNLSKLYFTVKNNKIDPDPASVVQIELNSGLMYLNGAPASGTYGSITVLDPSSGNIMVSLDKTQTRQLAPVLFLNYDVEFINTSGTVSTPTYGLLNILDDITKAIY